MSIARSQCQARRKFSREPRRPCIQGQRIGGIAILHLFAAIREGRKPMLVQALHSDVAIECFNEIIGRFELAREAQCDAFGVSSKVKIARQELSRLIDTHRLRIINAPWPRHCGPPATIVVSLCRRQALYISQISKLLNFIEYSVFDLSAQLFSNYRHVLSPSQQGT